MGYFEDQWSRLWGATNPPPAKHGTPMPAAGWSNPDHPPPASFNQSALAQGDTSRLWWTPISGPGYYYDADPNQAAKDAAAREQKAQGIDPATGLPINPYVEPGLLAVIQAVGTESQRTQAANDLTMYCGGDEAMVRGVVNTNAQADPLWNACIGRMLGTVPNVSTDPADVWEWAVASGEPLSFSEQTLQDAKPVTDRYV